MIDKYSFYKLFYRLWDTGLLNRFIPLSRDIFPWMQEFVEFVSISPRQRSLSRLKNKRWIFPGGSRDNVLSSTSSTDKWSSSAVTSLGRYYRAPILSLLPTLNEIVHRRQKQSPSFIIPICTIRYHSLVKLIKHTRCNNCDRIFQFLKFPPIFKYKNRSKRFNTKTQFQFPDHSNPDRIHARYCANNPLSPSTLLPSKGTKISLYLDQFKPLSRDIRSSLRNNERRRVENVETGKNGGFGGRWGGEGRSPVTYIFKIGRTFRPQKCPAGPASTSFVGKPSLFPHRSARACVCVRAWRGRKGEGDDDKELPN